MTQQITRFTQRRAGSAAWQAALEVPSRPAHLRDIQHVVYVGGQCFLLRVRIHLACRSAGRAFA